MKRPCGTTPEAAQPEQVGAAARLRVDLLAKAAAAPGAAAAPPSFARVEDIAASRIAPSIVCETPSISFSAMLPVKPSVTITSAAPLDDVAALDVADELERRAVPARPLGELRVGLEHERAAARRLLAVGEQPDARALHAEHRSRQRGAHERELHEVLAPRLRVRADVEQRHRMVAAPAAGSPAPGGRCRARA